MSLKRFGVSLESELLDELDKLVISNRFPNRSQAIRFLIHKNQIEEKWSSNQEVAGAIVITYDHNLKDLHKKVNSLQHEYHCLILAGQHIHIDDHNCLEVIAVKGNAGRLEKLANKLKALKGIKHSELLKSGMS
jgi:CopG family transcriptional regulator, nickel-responsive regulator